MLSEIKYCICEEETVDLLCKMLRFDTTNPPGNEKPLVEMLAAYLSDRGLEVIVDDFGNNRANLTARLRGKGNKKALMLNGHTDVVPPGELSWKHPPFEPVIIDNHIYGRGTSDMKGGLAAMIQATLAVQKSGFPIQGDVIITCSASEETDSMGAFDYLGRHGLDDVGAIIIGEPSSCGINIAAKGTFWVDIVTIGRTAHGSFPETGINAIVGMNKIISGLLDYKFDIQPHPVLGMPSMSIATIQGGVKTNVVPDRCLITVDTRATPGLEGAKLLADYTAICEAAKKSMPGLEYEIKVTSDFPSVQTLIDHPFVKLSCQVIKDEFNKEVHPTGVNFYTDLSTFVPPSGLPAVIYGPGDANMAHQPNENISLNSLHEATHFYAAMIERYLG